MKYKTLSELKSAYESGELSKDNPLCLDNDSTFAYADGEDGPQVFEGGNPEHLLEAALDLLGIPWKAA